jgi:hypothetical protein
MRLQRPRRRADIPDEPDLAMARALPPTLAVLVLAGLLAAEGATAGPKAGETRGGSSFVLLTSAPPVPAAAQPRSNGVGVPPARPVVLDPYRVPLLSNAGTLGSAR